MEITTLPKIELHVHLDCSLSFAAVQQMIPALSEFDYHQKLIGPFKCRNLSHYLECAQYSVGLLQSRKNLRIAVFDLLNQQKEDQIIYSEIRFSPFEHIKEGLSPEEVVVTVLEAIKDASELYQIRSNLILCTLRHYSEAYSKITADLAIAYAKYGVVALDLASDEANYSLDAHIKAFRKVKEHGLSITAHAGEAAGSESVWETIEKLQPDRIGHGVRSGEDSALIEYLANHQIHLEVCPSSNIQTNVYEKYSDHVIEKLIDSGISTSINSDARTISNIHLRKEYKKLEKVFNWDSKQFYHCNLEAIKHAFIDQNEKNMLIETIQNRYERFSAKDFS
jgi:adenosine deaminase